MQVSFEAQNSEAQIFGDLISVLHISVFKGFFSHGFENIRHTLKNITE
jgi:hypothetical protein